MSEAKAAVAAGPGAKTRRLARDSSGFTRDRLTDEVTRATAILILDTLGVMLAGSRPELPGTAHMRDYVKQDGSGGHLFVGSSIRTGASAAAVANGYLAYALDSDALYRPGIMHVGAAVLPAVLAAAEQADSSGADVLTATALGIEVASRASQAIGPADLYARGYHPTAVGGAFGAAAAAGNLLRLDEDRMERAFGLAATQSAGLLAWTTDSSEESRPFTAGLASRNGIVAAMLAAADFGGPRGIFDPESKYNVYRTWSIDQANPELWDRPIDAGEAVSQLVYKIHGCCGFLHPAVDAMLELRELHGFGPDQVAHIAMRFPAAGAPVIDNNGLRSHCAQYVLPLAAVLGRVDFDDVLVDRAAELGLDRPGLATEVIHDGELDKVFPATRTTVLEVTLTDGTRLVKMVVAAKGSPENPFTDDEIFAKFDRMAARRVTHDRVARLRQELLELDSIPRFSRVMEDLAV